MVLFRAYNGLTREVNKLEKMISREIKIVHHILSRRFYKYTKKYVGEDATVMHIWILSYIARSEPKEVFQKDIEREFELAKSTTTSILKLMERKELIVRVSVDYDDRLKQIKLTDKGRDITCTMWDNIIKSDFKLVQGIDKEKLDTFYEVLEQIKSNAEKELT